MTMGIGIRLRLCLCLFFWVLSLATIIVSSTARNALPTSTSTSASAGNDVRKLLLSMEGRFLTIHDSGWSSVRSINSARSLQMKIPSTISADHHLPRVGDVDILDYSEPKPNPAHDPRLAPPRVN